MTDPAEAGEILARLLSAPFPASQGAPLESCSFDAIAELLTPSPRRLVQVFDAGYYDPQQAEPGQEPDPIAIETSYRRRFAAAVASAEEHFGAALRPGSDAAPWSRFDDSLHYLDQHDFACWPVGNRLAIIHFGWVFGDDDFEAALTAQVMPDDRKP